ncbi:MAG: DUF2207 domain-containing protein [Desulfovibrionaceae bacterium]|nr:DUF2207 domain-containing protein [Desulfovibrionaceae bacterium]
MNVRVALSDEDRITVTEDMLAAIPTDGTHHGMYRDIPINPRWKGLERRNVTLTVRSILIDGVPQSTNDTRSMAPFFRIYLRDKDRFLSAGVHRFVLTYDITQQIGFFENQDELVWNVTGPGWSQGIGAAHCLVLPPPGTSFTDSRAWAGVHGSTESPVSIAPQEYNGRMALSFQKNGSLFPGEEFTIAVAWPKGFVREPEKITPGSVHWLTASLTLLFIATLGTCWLLWRRWGKDPDVGPAFPLFNPPALPDRLRKYGPRRDTVLSPAAVNFIWNKNHLEPRGMAALFLSLIGQGLCAAEQAEKGKFILKGLESGSPHPEEELAAKRLQNKQHINVGPENASFFHGLLQSCSKNLYLDYGRQWKDNILQIALCFLVPLCGLFLLFRAYMGPLHSWPLFGSDGIETVLALLVLLAVPGFALCSSLVDIFKGRNIFRSLIILLVTLPILLLVLWGMDWGAGVIDIRALGSLFSPYQLLLIALTLITPFIFAPIMDSSTAEYARLRKDIEGLAMYIGAAESDRLNMENPPDKPLVTYRRLLPYAVALGLEKAWGSRFAQELAEAQKEGVYSDSTLFFTSPSMLDSFTSMTTQSIAAYSPPRPSSSGFSFGGGGGYSGGGGGGGGGGGC